VWCRLPCLMWTSWPASPLTPPGSGSLQDADWRHPDVALNLRKHGDSIVSCCTSFGRTACPAHQVRAGRLAWLWISWRAVVVQPAHICTGSCNGQGVGSHARSVRCCRCCLQAGAGKRAAAPAVHGAGAAQSICGWWAPGHRPHLRDARGSSSWWQAQVSCRQVPAGPSGCDALRAHRQWSGSSQQMVSWHHPLQVRCSTLQLALEDALRCFHCGQ